MASGSRPKKPRVFIGRDVLFAGAASPAEHSASQVVLRMAEITLVEAVCTEQVLVEVQRNLKAKLPGAISAFELLADRCLDVRSDPEPGEVERHAGEADAKDLPLLVAALRGGALLWLHSIQATSSRGTPTWKCYGRVHYSGECVTCLRAFLELSA